MNLPVACSKGGLTAATSCVPCQLPPLPSTIKTKAPIFRPHQFTLIKHPFHCFFSQPGNMLPLPRPHHQPRPQRPRAAAAAFAGAAAGLLLLLLAARAPAAGADGIPVAGDPSQRPAGGLRYSVGVGAAGGANAAGARSMLCVGPADEVLDSVQVRWRRLVGWFGLVCLSKPLGFTRRL